MSTKSAESKQRILQAAMDLIKEKGYDSVTINDICAAANISKNTFYYYFKSKEELLLQFYSVPSNATLNNLTSILMEESNTEQYWKFVEPMLDFIVDSGTEITKNMIYALTNKNIQPFNLSGLHEERTAVGIKIIERAQSSGEIRNSFNPGILFTTMKVMSLGVILSWCAKNGEFDLKNAVRLSMEVCFDLKPELRKAEQPDVFTEDLI